MKGFNWIPYIFVLVLLSSRHGLAVSPQAVNQVVMPSTLETRIMKELERSYPEAKIELIGSIHWERKPSTGQIASITSSSEDGHGSFRFSVRDSKQKVLGEGSILFAAWTPVRIATRRLKPFEPIETGAFRDELVDLAQGPAREFRGILLTRRVALNKLEATQTILEGQYLTSTAVRRIPDVRRGDPLQIQIRSGGLVIRTPGTAEEPSYLDRTIRVQTLKGKKELSGVLLPSGVVEVRL